MFDLTPYFVCTLWLWMHLSNDPGRLCVLIVGIACVFLKLKIILISVSEWEVSMLPFIKLMVIFFQYSHRKFYLQCCWNSSVLTSKILGEPPRNTGGGGVGNILTPWWGRVGVDWGIPQEGNMKPIETSEGERSIRGRRQEDNPAQEGGPWRYRRKKPIYSHVTG